jgi:hypothetical protein
MIYVKTYIVFILPFFINIISFSLYGQYYNTKVEAKIHLENNNEFININSSANNKTEISQSLRYTLSVIKTDPESGNKSKNDQAGRIVLQPSETQKLSSTTINSTTSRIIILLLVFDLDDNILGKDRMVLNDNFDDNIVPDTIQNRDIFHENRTSSEDLQNKGEDGIFLLKGIVVEDTKTKPGRDFFKYYSDKYNAKRINGEEIITVVEIFALGRNTKIEIRAGDEVIFNFFVRPKQEFLEEMSDYAIEFTQRYFKRRRANKNQSKRY